MQTTRTVPGALPGGGSRARESHEIIRAVAGKDVLAGVVGIGGGVLLIVGSGLYLWWDINYRWEYVNERPATCTITHVVPMDVDTEGYVETAQCGVLAYKKWHPVDVEAGHTYRLRIAEIEPQYGPDITCIMAVEGEAEAP